jgi:Methyltransferase domain
MGHPADDGAADIDGADGDAEPYLERVEVLADDDRPGGYLLLIDRVRQSYVDLQDPTYLDFEYMRWFAAVVDAVFDPVVARALNVTHVGGGAGAMARWVEATRPGSSHLVLDPDTEMVDLVRRRLPFPRHMRIRIRPTPGRAGLAELRTAGADLVVLDAFAGARVPADLTTAECFAEIGRILRDGGLFLANVGDGATMNYTRRLCAGLRQEVGEPLVISEKRVYGGTRFGNVVIAASPAPIDLTAVRRNLSAQIVPAQIRTGTALRGWIAGLRPFTDADSARSPEPPEAAWRVPR